MEVAKQGREGERGCSEETGRLQTRHSVFLLSSSQQHEVGEQKGCLRFAVLFLHWGMRFWTVKLLWSGLRSVTSTVDLAWLLDAGVAMVVFSRCH